LPWDKPVDQDSTPTIVPVHDNQRSFGKTDMKKILGWVLGGSGTLFVILAIILWAKNPDQSDFEAFIKKEDEKRREAMVKEEKGIALITGLLGELPKGASASIEREEYYLFSTYCRKYSILGIDHTKSSLPEPEKYVGVLGTFFKFE